MLSIIIITLYLLIRPNLYLSVEAIIITLWPYWSGVGIYQSGHNHLHYIILELGFVISQYNHHVCYIRWNLCCPVSIIITLYYIGWVMLSIGIIITLCYN
jgi:hypothetical protein